MSTDELKEQRTIIKFFVADGKTGNEILNSLQRVYGKSTMSKSAVYEWVARFKAGRESVEDEKGRGRKVETRTPCNVERVKQIVNADRRLSIRDVAFTLDMN